MSELSTRVFRIRVQLRWIDPPIWRQLLVPERISLTRLHRLLQAAMGWTDSHLYDFRFGDGRRYVELASQGELREGDLEAYGLPLTALELEEGSRLAYTYDFGDDWIHDLFVEEVREARDDEILPALIDGERACPPENSGGPPGYANLLAALRDRDAADPNLLSWIPVGFDPERFDRAAHQRALESGRSPHVPLPSGEPRVSLGALDDALVLTLMHHPEEAIAAVDRSSGELRIRALQLGEEGLTEEDLENEAGFAILPQPYDLELGAPLVDGFVSEEIPELADSVRSLFRGKGAFRRFKELLRSHGLLDAWDAHEQAARERVLIAWCEAQGLGLVEDEPS